MATKRPKIKNQPPAPPAPLRLEEVPIANSPYSFLFAAKGVRPQDLTIEERLAMATRHKELEGKIPKYTPRSHNSYLPKEFVERMDAVGNGALAIAQKYAKAEAATKPTTAPVAASPAKAPSKAPKSGTKRGKAADFIAKHTHDGSVAMIADLAKELAELVEIPLSTAGKWIKNGHTG